MREFNAFMILVSHPNIITLFGWTYINCIPAIVTEMADIDLLAHVRSVDSEKAQFKDFAKILWQLSNALEYCASRGIIHRDVACRNVLLFNNCGLAKLGDFGLACFRDEETQQYKEVLHKKFPFKWLSIEALENGIFSEKSDVWAFGVACFEVFSHGAVPYSDIESAEILAFLEADNRLERPSDAPKEVYELMLQCWCKLSEERPTFQSISDCFRKWIEIETASYGYLAINEVE